MLKELEKFDPVWSMSETVRLVQGVIKGIEPAPKLKPEHAKAIKIVEEKMAIAEDWYERPLDSPEVYEKLASIAEALGEKSKAKGYKRKIARFRANEIEFLGRQQEFFGNCVEALKHYEDALGHTPDHPLALPGSEKMRAAIQKAKTNMPKLREKTGKKPDDPKVWLELGNALLAIGDVKEAIECFDKALKLAPTDVKALCRRATAMESQGNFKDALPYLEKALEVQQTSNTAKRGKSYAEFNLGLH